MNGDWHSFLAQVSTSILREREEFEDDLPPGSAETQWLGTDGASEDEIAAVERRLGIALPPGYRAFLETTNGFGPVGLFVRRLLSAHELAWLRDVDPDLVAIWADEGGLQLEEALVVSEPYDGAYVLLIPNVRDADGEWPAWFFAHWVPGADEFASFRALLEESHRRAIEHMRGQRGEPTPTVAPELGVAADDLERLVAALDRPDVAAKDQALKALANLRDPDAAAAVAARLLDVNEDEWVRETAARTLGQLRHPESVAALIEILHLPYPQGRMFDPERRSEPQERMIGLKHAARQGLLAPPLRELAEPAVRALLLDPDPDLRAEAGQVVAAAHSWERP